MSADAGSGAGVNRSMPEKETVCVVIAAYNAQATIERAVRSALRAGHVAEVIVVDDFSSDATREKVLACDDGTGRLTLLASEANGGPAAARNRALETATSPLVAILDADDFFLPDRFATLLDGNDWDLVADNIVFIHPDQAASFEAVEPFRPRPRFLDLAAFIDGNISRRGKRRGEIGFLKPVMRRSFLDEHRLRYRETLRLGEDYELYTRALAHGARYKVVHSCGYVAVERPDSLSGKHQTADLLRLLEADEAILHSLKLDEDAKRAIVRHAQQIRTKYEHRRFLDIKREQGLLTAGRHAVGNTRYLPAIAGAILADKLDAVADGGRRKSAATQKFEPRYLFANNTRAA